MPGVTLEDIVLCRAPIDQIKKRSFQVFAALARTKVAFVRTHSPTGEKDELAIPISEYCPNISTGAIDKGTWGNFPSGETFVVPNPYASAGKMTLRGSFPKHILGDRDWVRFEIFRGRLRYKSIEASSSSLKTEFTRLFFGPKGRVAFANANTIAELGVGTNSAVTQLTGNPIFDEKQLGTIHLGLGSNTQFHGPIHSNAHNDITCIGATLETTSVAIVKEGRFILTEDQAIPSLESAGRMRGSSEGAFRYSQRMLYDFNNPEEMLCLSYFPYRGSEIKVPVAATGVIDVAKWILDEAKSHSSVAFRDLLTDLPKRFDPTEAKNVFDGLVELGLLEAVDDKGDR